MISRRTMLGTFTLSLLAQIFYGEVKAGHFSSISGKFFPENRFKSLQSDRLMKAHTQFSFKLFSQITQDKPAKNLFISPASVSIALSLLYNGADGQTQREMSQVLGVQDMTLAEINQANQQLHKMLESSHQAVQVNLANSLWVKQGVSFRHQFLRNNREYFDAEITNLNFANPQSVGIINRWVAQNTQGKITEIIDKIQAQDILFLINVIYFKGIWQYQFDPNLTGSEDFYLSDGQSKKHPLMSQSRRFWYQETEDFQAISLPYGKANWRFEVFLPQENRNLTTFLSQLNEANWTQWTQNFRQQEGLLKLPRFRSEYEIELDSILQTLGMKSAFIAGKADFSKMTSYPVVVDSVKHKTFVEVNEEGTEAAAATSIGVRVTSAMLQNEPFKMVVNRPFFYSIRDTETGTILFMGTMVNPSE